MLTTEFDRLWAESQQKIAKIAAKNGSIAQVVAQSVECQREPPALAELRDACREIGRKSFATPRTVIGGPDPRQLRRSALADCLAELRARSALSPLADQMIGWILETA